MSSIAPIPKLRTKSLNPFPKLVVEIKQFMMSNDSWKDELLKEIPMRWERHGDLVILPASAFEDEVWYFKGELLWSLVSDVLRCQRLAKQIRILNDDFRTPQVVLLKGHSSLVEHIDNGIKYSFDITRCMFSSGNITEKLRIARFNCEQEIVVDLYAGIGYFTLPFLIHANALHVHACEWNPKALEALEQNFKLNKVDPKRWTIHPGDNKDANLCNIADRVNLGLIPTSRGGWEVACRALKVSGGVLHIHQNVDSPVNRSNDNTALEPDNVNVNEDAGKEKKDKWAKSCGNKPEWLEFANETALTLKNILHKCHGGNWFTRILHIECVKFYAPHVAHIVVDMECKPVTS